MHEALDGLQTAGAPGPDGLRPCHLKQLCGLTDTEAREEAFNALRGFAETCLAGDFPQRIRPALFGASLCALRKKDGISVRPIAVGFVLRRFLSRYYCVVLRNQITAELAPKQVGVGVRGGAKTAVHATRRFLHKCDTNCGIVKLDFKNAFNCVLRNHMLKCVLVRMPSIYSYVNAAYGSQLVLRFLQYRIAFAAGVQQGDPLGPLLFALSIRHLSWIDCTIFHLVSRRCNLWLERNQNYSGSSPH